MNLQEKLQANKTELINSFMALNKPDLEFKSADNVWSILEVLEHIFMIDKAVLKAISVAPTPTNENTFTELLGEQKINTLLVINRNHKVPAPDFSNPKGRFISSEDALQNLNSIIDTIVKYINDNKIEQETHTIKHLVLGEMTKIDWIHFMIAHTSRHILQIEELKEFVNATKV